MLAVRRRQRFHHEATTMAGCLKAKNTIRRLFCLVVVAALVGLQLRQGLTGLAKPMGPEIPRSNRQLLQDPEAQTHQLEQPTSSARVDEIKSIPASSSADPILDPIFQAGEFYTVGRKDRSGSAISDMLYAHAFAKAHNVTYAGACHTLKGFPRKETLHLLHELQWSTILPFACPEGVGPHLNILSPNATALSPLMLHVNVYRDKIEHSYFTPDWRRSVQDQKSQEFAIDDEINTPVDRPFEVAVHVRRGDVSPCKHKQRYLPNEHYLKLIDQYTPTPKERGYRPVNVTIYSESDSFEPFDVFEERNYTVALDTEDLAVVWKALTTADLVILSRSFFSFVPASVNPNTVVWSKFNLAEPLIDWKEAGEALVAESDRKVNEMGKLGCNKANADATTPK